MIQLVGILNLTPDSFSGDGLQHSPLKSIEQMDSFIRDGADMIDMGAESTRPGAVLLTSTEEWQRLEPVMPAVRQRIGKTRFSIDTRHAETAQQFLDYVGKENASYAYINDVSGGSDTKLIELARTCGAGLILMHSLSVPADPKVTIPADEDAVDVVCKWAAEVVRKFGKGIIIDPGIGFGKMAEQSLSLVIHIAKLKTPGAKILVGHSRKSFLTLFTDKKANERDPETLFFSGYLARRGVDYLRVHDIKSHAEMLKEVK